MCKRLIHIIYLSKNIVLQMPASLERMSNGHSTVINNYPAGTKSDKHLPPV